MEWMPKLCGISVVVLMLAAATTFAEPQEFTQDAIISDGDIYVDCYVNGASSDDITTFTMNGGMCITVTMYEHSEFIMNGGAIDTMLNVLPRASAELIGGSIKYASAGGSLVMRGGNISYALEVLGATCELRGGELTRMWATPESVIDVYGYGMAVDPTGGEYGNGLLTGQWESGRTFAISLRDVDDQDVLVLHTAPEPASLAVVVLSGIGMIHRRR